MREGSGLVDDDVSQVSTERKDVKALLSNRSALLIARVYSDRWFEMSHSQCLCNGFLMLIVTNNHQ